MSMLSVPFTDSLLRSGEDCKQLPCLGAKRLHTLRRNDLRLCEDFQPEDTLICLFDNNAELCKKLSVRPRSL